MRIDDVTRISDELVNNLPPTVQHAITLIEIVVVENELSPELEFLPRGIGFRGLYRGTQITDEDEEGESEDPVPDGTIYLCAGNLSDAEDVKKVLLHEIGHALGLSEYDVENLGLE